MNPIVYLIQEPTSDKDLSSAAKYGKIVPLIGSDERPSTNIQFTINKLISILQNFNAEEDYICFAGGDPVIPMLIGVVMERLNFDEFNYLVWNRSRNIDGCRTGAGFYVPKKMTIFKDERTNNDN